MDQKKADERNTDDENEAGPSKVLAANPPNSVVVDVEQTGDIFKLDIDCYEESFDYLPLEDLASVGKTCKRLQGVAGYCFQQNYMGAQTSITRKGIETHASRLGLNTVNVTHFAPFIRKLCFTTNDIKYFLNAQSKLHRLNQMVIYNTKGIGARIDQLITKKIWSKLEILHIICCNVSNNSHEIINQCVKLKRLSFQHCIDDFDWLNHKYPTLEYLKYQNAFEPIGSIPSFLVLHPNIRKFATSAGLILNNRDDFMSANVNLDDLAIWISFVEDDELQSTYGLLNELHEREFHKKLQLYYDQIHKQEAIKRMSNLKGLNKLVFWGCAAPFAFSALKDLEELEAGRGENVVDLEMLPDNLVNLKRINFSFASIDGLMPFIRRSVEMQRIVVGTLGNGVHFNKNTGIINLLALNREREVLSTNRKRELLPDAQKVTLCVEEWIYLATKWAMKGNDFEFIRLRRAESLEFDLDFS